MAAKQHSDASSVLLEALYGDAAWEIAKRMGQQSSFKDNALRGAAIAGTAAGALLGVTEVGHGVRGVLRQTGRADGTAMRIASKIPRMPGGPKTQLGVAGTMLGADVLATNELKKPKQPKTPGIPTTGVVKHVCTDECNHGGTPKGRLMALGAKGAVKAAQKAQEKAPAVRAKLQEQIGKAAIDDVHWQGEISKMDSDKRQVFGWASIVEINGQPVVDLQDDYMTIEEIEKAAYDYVQNSRKGGDQHERIGDQPRHVSDMIESFLVTPEKKAQLGLPDEMPVGWWVGFQVHDDDTWSKVKSGERKEFSIHGSGVRKDIDL